MTHITELGLDVNKLSVPDPSYCSRGQGALLEYMQYIIECRSTRICDFSCCELDHLPSDVYNDGWEYSPLGEAACAHEDTGITGVLLLLAASFMHGND